MQRSSRCSSKPRLTTIPLPPHRMQEATWFHHCKKTSLTWGLIITNKGIPSTNTCSLLGIIHLHPACSILEFPQTFRFSEPQVKECLTLTILTLEWTNTFNTLGKDSPRVDLITVIRAIWTLIIKKKLSEVTTRESNSKLTCIQWWVEMKTIQWCSIVCIRTRTTSNRYQLR